MSQELPAAVDQSRSLRPGAVNVGSQQERSMEGSNVKPQAERWKASMTRPQPSPVKQTWQVIEIIGGENPTARITAGDGSGFDRKLSKSVDGDYLVVGDTYGAKYRLASAGGDVGLFDDRGLIYYATRMAKSDPPEACLG